ncbi:MAG: hypothetical protein Greene041619_561 [Candidatus Peregrinibacteria bacterium Greene0416_19]|nr:MAG: hypothetical protein Greene041619_561 [Candidatus Peregrinibacteria bacterium Greene0416_19]
MNTAIILHIPHASTVIPPKIRSTFLLTDKELEEEFLRMTDWYTNELFALPGEHAVTITYPVSRLVVDPERFTEDGEEPMAKVGMGVIYTRTSDEKKLRHDPTPEQRKMLLQKYYEPHHARLTTEVENILKEHGKCLIIDGHSFSSRPLPHEPDQRSNRPDICIGTDSFHTPPALVAAAMSAFEAQGFSVALDRPFQGTLVPMRHYRKERRVSSVMIEVRRDLYMDEETGRKNDRFPAIRAHLESALFSLMECFENADKSHAKSSSMVH